MSSDAVLRPAVIHRSLRVARGRLSTAHAGLAATSAVLAWEWTLSTSHKVTSDFSGQFPVFIASSMGQGRPRVVNDFLAHALLRPPPASAVGGLRSALGSSARSRRPCALACWPALLRVPPRCWAGWRWRGG